MLSPSACALAIRNPSISASAACSGPTPNSQITQKIVNPARYTELNLHRLSAHAQAPRLDARSDVPAQLRAKFFGDVMSIGAIADDLGTDKDDQLGTGTLFVLMGKAVAQAR